MRPDGRGPVERKVELEEVVRGAGRLDGMDHARRHPACGQKRKVAEMRADVEDMIARFRPVLRHATEENVVVEAVLKHLLVRGSRTISDTVTADRLDRQSGEMALGNA